MIYVVLVVSLSGSSIHALCMPFMHLPMNCCHLYRVRRSRLPFSEGVRGDGEGVRSVSDIVSGDSEAMRADSSNMGKYYFSIIVKRSSSVCKPHLYLQGFF